MLLITSALLLAGCSGDASRFGDFYTTAAPAGAVPPGLDMRTTASIGTGYAKQPAITAASGALVPGANVAPRPVAGGFPTATVTTNPGYPVAATGGWPDAPAGVDARPVGAIAPAAPTVARGTLAPLASAPNPVALSVRDDVDADPVPAAASAEGDTGPSRSRSLADRVRRVVGAPKRPAEAPREVASMKVPTDNAALNRVVTAGETRRGGWSAAGGTRISVGEGVTLYNLSKRFGVPVVAIMDANGIKDPTTVRLGQQLVIPTYVYSRTAKVSAPDSEPLVRAAAASTGMLGEASGPVPTPRPRTARVMTASAPAVSEPVRAAAPVVADGGSTVTVRSGDTLYAIARRAGVTVEALKTANNMAGNGIAIGQTLRLPGSEPVQRIDRTMTASIEPVAPTREVLAPVSEPAPKKPRALPRVSQPKPVEPAPTAEQAIAAAPAVAAPASTDAGKLRWPAKGRVIRDFGGAQKGLDIAVPAGSSIRAAENGTVIYAGSGLKQYGKTVLIQHADGIVTVYGHADAINVAKGQKVSRGDVIASSGMTGSADSPRVHFQVRKGSKPVDPTSFLN